MKPTHLLRLALAVSLSIILSGCELINAKEVVGALKSEGASTSLAEDSSSTGDAFHPSRGGTPHPRPNDDAGKTKSLSEEALAMAGTFDDLMESVREKLDQLCAFDKYVGDRAGMKACVLSQETEWKKWMDLIKTLTEACFLPPPPGVRPEDGPPPPKPDLTRLPLRIAQILDKKLTSPTCGDATQEAEAALK